MEGCPEAVRVKKQQLGNAGHRPSRRAQHKVKLRLPSRKQRASAEASKDPPQPQRPKGSVHLHCTAGEERSATFADLFCGGLTLARKWWVLEVTFPPGCGGLRSQP